MLCEDHHERVRSTGHEHVDVSEKAKSALRTSCTMSEWLYGSSPASPLGLAEAAFYDVPGVSARVAA
jgi:hypothetical protein